MKTFFSRISAFFDSLNFRYVYMVIFSIAILVSLFLADPDNGFIQEMKYGAGLVVTLVLLVKPALSITLLHFSRKGLFDYVDFSTLYEKAKEEPVSAAIFAIAIAIAMHAIATVIAAYVGH